MRTVQLLISALFRTSRFLVAVFHLAIGDFQHADIEEREDQQINGHDPDPHVLLKIPEHHRHKSAADIRRCHLQADDSRTVAFAEIRWSHVLDGGINRAHPHADDNESDGCEKIPRYRQDDQQDTDHFNGNTNPNQQPVAQFIGDKTRNQSPQHQSAEDKGAEGGDGLCT